MVQMNHCSLRSCAQRRSFSCSSAILLCGTYQGQSMRAGGGQRLWHCVHVRAPARMSFSAHNRCATPHLHHSPASKGLVVERAQALHHRVSRFRVSQHDDESQQGGTEQENGRQHERPTQNLHNQRIPRGHRHRHPACIPLRYCNRSLRLRSPACS